jgi:hypothetical protein
MVSNENSNKNNTGYVNAVITKVNTHMVPQKM